MSYLRRGFAPTALLAVPAALAPQPAACGATLALRGPQAVGLLSPAAIPARPLALSGLDFAHVRSRNRGVIGCADCMPPPSLGASPIALRWGPAHHMTGGVA